MNQPKLPPPLYKFIFILIVAALVAAISLAWLRKNDEPPPAVTDHDFDSGHAIWSIDGYPAKVLKDNRFVIELTERSGAPLTGAELAVKLEMLDMVCGDYEFTMTEAAPGIYEGDGVPLMAGMWKATMTLKTGSHTYKIVRLLKAAH